MPYYKVWYTTCEGVPVYLRFVLNSFMAIHSADGNGILRLKQKQAELISALLYTVPCSEYSVSHPSYYRNKRFFEIECRWNLKSKAITGRVTMMKFILSERDLPFFNFSFSNTYTHICVPHVWHIWVAVLKIVLFATQNSGWRKSSFILPWWKSFPFIFWIYLHKIWTNIS